MIDALRVVWRALRHLNHRGYVYIWANFAALLCSLPIITAPAAWAALVKLSYQAHLSPTTDLDDFKDGLKENLRRGLLMGVLNLIVVGINVVNLMGYTGQSGTLVGVMRFVWVGTLAVWFSVQFYMWPIFYHMEQPALLGAMRNALVMIYLNPFFTLMLWLIIALILAASTALVAAWALLTLSTLAVIATEAVFDRLGVAVLLLEQSGDEHAKL